MGQFGGTRQMLGFAMCHITGARKTPVFAMCRITGTRQTKFSNT
jgi:hypothetical protein